MFNPNFSGKIAMILERHTQQSNEKPRIDKRVERNTQSVFALRDYLQEVLQEPSRFIEEVLLLTALKSQSAVSKYHNEKRSIYISSINTLKRICNKSIDGGFEALDRLRIAALRAIEDEQQKTKRSNKITRRGMSQRIIELNAENQILQQELLLISHLLEKSLRQARHCADQAMHDNVRMLCEKEQKEIRAYLSLSINADIFKSKVKQLTHA